MLSGQVSRADIDRLILTRGYERLLAGVGTLTGTDIGTQRVVNGLVSQELQQRVDALDQAVKALAAQVGRWSGPEVFGVLDTSVYIEHDDKLEVMDFAATMSLTWMDKPVHVLVPAVVMDELDGLKRSKDRDVRWRAGYTLAVFDRLFAKSTGPAVLRAPDPESGRGGVMIEAFFDPADHVRLPINDDEIIDRALAIQALAGRQVALLTYDTSQSMRARNVGLPVRKLAKPLDSQSAERSNGSRA
jgi:rRNA-processing protein FCF1